MTYLGSNKLINICDGNSSFLEGSIPELKQIKASYFFANDHIEAWERGFHPAPKRQFVITLTGKLRFTVTNGDTFVIEPGVILIADDTLQKGHTWELIEGKEWSRIYIVLDEDADDCFQKKD
jgi:hypothetical protein